LKKNFTVTLENVSNIIPQIEGYIRNWLLQNKCKWDAKEIIEGRDTELQKIPEINGVRTHN
jgi:hypothetical protein